MRNNAKQFTDRIKNWNVSWEYTKFPRKFSRQNSPNKKYMYFLFESILSIKLITWKQTLTHFFPQSISRCFFGHFPFQDAKN